MILSAGEVFRRFRVIAKVGEGGMGVVYRAHDMKLGRDVALKFVTEAAGAASAELSDRLRREGGSLAALNHPNIVTIHDIDEVDGVPYLVLEWIDGRPLSDPSFPRPLPLAEFGAVTLAVAEALAAAHEREIIHRDVKLSNVLLSNDGRTKVVDFGIATASRRDADATRTAGTIGTIAYMSPEQVRGDHLTPASDVYSFGVLAHELLAGQRPSHVTLAQRRPDLPVSLIALIERCLEPDPSRRFQTGAALAAALRPLVAASNSADTIANAELPTMPLTRDEPQAIQFCTTADGVQLAYSVTGSGPLLVRVLGHFTHLEMEWEWPDLRRLWQGLAERHTVLRYDGRGTGLSDRFGGHFTEDTRQLDLDAVLTSVGARRATLFGISEGGWTAATFANQHPQQIERLILFGAYCRGARARPGYDAEEDRALMTLVRKGWGRDTPAFRQVFTSQFFREDADPKLIAHFNEMQRVSADADTAARYYESCHARGDGRDIFRQIRIPTLVIHSRDDIAVSAEEGRLLASLIPGAQLVLLPSGAHYFPTDPEVTTRVVDAINRFTDG